MFVCGLNVVLGVGGKLFWLFFNFSSFRTHFRRVFLAALVRAGRLDAIEQKR